MINSTINVTDVVNYYQIASFCVDILLICVAVCGLVGNCVAIYVFTSPEMRGNSINLILATLAVLDALVATVGAMVFSALGICVPLSEQHSFNCDTTIAFFTKYLYPIAMMAQTASIWTLMLIAAERFIAIRFPLQVQRLCTVYRAKVFMSLIVLLSVCYNAIRFFEYNIVDQHNVNHLGFLEPVLRDDPHYAQVYILWLNFVTHLAIPFALLIIFNGIIVFNMRSATFVQRFKAIRVTRRLNEQRITWMMLAITLQFLICNCLCFVLNVIEATGNVQKLGDRLFFFLCDVNNLLTEIDAAVNCVIYYRFSVKYRRRCNYLLKGICCGKRDALGEMMRTTNLLVDANEIFYGLGLFDNRRRSNGRLSVSSAGSKAVAFSPELIVRLNGHHNGTAAKL